MKYVSGIVESVGNKVSDFNAGDEVFATMASGSYAELKAVNQKRVIKKTDNFSFNEAAALALPMATSYAVLVEAGQLHKEQKVLIQGVSGAGSIMLQMAKALGAYFIGIATSEGIGLIKSLGVDEAIDYKTQDVATLVKEADPVADLAGGSTLSNLFEVLRKRGNLLSIVMQPPDG